MLTLTEKALFTLAALFAVYGTGLGFSTVFKIIQRGQSPALKLDWRRTLRAMGAWITMGGMWKMRPLTSTIHASLAWGFVLYLLVNVVDLARGYFSTLILFPDWITQGYRLTVDLASGAVLLAMLLLLLRRFILPGREVLTQRDNILRIKEVRLPFLRQTISRDSAIVGFFILFHVGFRLLGESVAIGLHGPDPWQPLASSITPLWSDLSPNSLTIWHHVCWWGALGLILAFAPYFPYTKHFHFIMAGVNFITQEKRSSPGALDPIDFEDENTDVFGALTLEQLPQSSIADTFACIMCNRCQDVCPAYATGKELSPAALEINKRYFVNEHLSDLAAGGISAIGLTEYAITEAAVWACTACGACTEICPVANAPMHDILQIRRGLVLMEDQYPETLESVYQGMERNGNPWNMSVGERMGWAKDLQVPTVEENPDAELLWWVGCAPSYDKRAQETARALVRILQTAEVSFSILGNRERCTGDSARRSGNEYLFSELAGTNIATLNQVKPKRIMTTCPHCLHTLGKEYSAMGGHYHVIHHTELLSELADQGRIPVEVLQEDVTFHDPCYLGRQNDITEAPRSVLENVGATTIEMPRNKKNSFCCGAGGAQMWMEEPAPRINDARYVEAAATGADTVATGCPFCLTMLRDAATKAGPNGPAIKDVAEIIAERLPAESGSR
ncbi:MAG: (Fe-S)-binding protein [Rhodothermaceae bacterium]|nr:(Fe-S)-binding protein [Rhodothermaceae bacterium]MXZ56889.1 (Fe-S)-binding protein [Rhodothermaceae bacterium]MYB91436.1 (Fe-S)-binding protein [Rhodothermaceae bacterium]MYD67862.1 (Fe-S)-binding protein [Rhodothermaceae bacterium]MYG43547.1 (Fe-S)-binding protein [Rhodothermaceae bacterium]